MIQPFLRKKTRAEKFKYLLNHFQGGYKEKYQWFAPYYLFCQLVIMLIVYFGNTDHHNMTYYMQTACVIITINHVSLQPYKKHILNILDTAILLTMLLVINLNNYNFSRSTIAGLIYTLLFIPLLLLLGMRFRKLLLFLKMKILKSNGIYNQVMDERYGSYIPCT